MMNQGKMVSIAVFLLRIVAAYLFIQVGGFKLLGWFDGPGWANLVPLMKVAGVLEFFGGLAVLVGVFARPVAFVLAGEMAVAYYMGHIQTKGAALVPILNDGQQAILFCFVFLFFAAYGAGSWSLDQWLKSKKVLGQDSEVV